jgi:hypothetical protein
MLGRGAADFKEECLQKGGNHDMGLLGEAVGRATTLRLGGRARAVCHSGHLAHFGLELSMVSPGISPGEQLKTDLIVREIMMGQGIVSRTLFEYLAFCAIG